MNTPATRLHDLADQVARLRPDWRSAERFYELRSDLAAELRAVAHELKGATMPPNDELSSIEVPAEYAGRVTQAEWDGIRERAIARQKQAVQRMTGQEYSRARNALVNEADLARRQASAAAELRGIESRYARKG